MQLYSLKNNSSVHTPPVVFYLSVDRYCSIYKTNKIRIVVLIK